MAFARVLAFAQRRTDGRVRNLRFRVGCPGLEEIRRRGNPRVFFHVEPSDKVCAVPQAADLSDCHLVGLMLHEIGHPLALDRWGRSDQVDADEAVLKILGVKLRYKGPLLLQWVPARVAERILA